MARPRGDKTFTLDDGTGGIVVSPSVLDDWLWRHLRCSHSHCAYQTEHRWKTSRPGTSLQLVGSASKLWLPISIFAGTVLAPADRDREIPLTALQVAPTALPQNVAAPDLAAGDYVVVIGRLQPGDPEAPSPDNYSIRASKASLETTRLETA